MVARPRLSISDIAADELDLLYEIETHSYSNPWPLDAFKRELKLPFSRILVARNNDHSGPAMLGYVVVWIIRGEAHVLNLAVHQDVRRQGVASMLLGAAIEAARMQAADILYLEVRRSNEGAQKLYNGFGFRQVGVRPRYYEDNREDALVMLLDLKKSPSAG
jgi:ribosomal-protein-alanine N-acetyltransferase